MSIDRIHNTDSGLEYKPDNFVDRPGEIKKVRDIATDLMAGRPREKRALALVSESGTGKTWLLRHLADEAVTPNGRGLVVGKKLSSESHGIYALYCDLGDWKDVPEQVTKSLIVAVSKRIADQMKAPSVAALGGGEAAPLDDLSHWLENEARRFTEQRVLVLLFDQVYESPWELLELLDRHLLGPLAGIPRTVTILAGRGRGYPWLSPELRYRCEPARLGPFKEEQVSDQVARQAKEKAHQAKEIYELSRGYPRRNYLIAMHGPEKGIEAEVEILLETLLGEGGEKLKMCLEALCVLRNFDDERLMAMVNAYDGRKIAEVTWRDATDLRNRLLGHGLVKWDDATGGWVLDECLRSALEDLLKLKEPASWQRLQQAALKLYEEWARNYPPTATIWGKEADYHRKALAEYARQPGQAPNPDPSQTG